MLKSKSERVDFKLSPIKILEVIFKHDYFNNGYFGGFKLFPDHYTKNILNNHNFIFKKTNNGFVIIFNPDQRFFSDFFSNEIKLNFEFEIIDNNFLSYTEMPFKNNQMISLSNDFNSNRLHSNDFVDSNSIVDSNQNGLKGIISLTLNKNNEIFGSQKILDEYMPHIYEVIFISRNVFFRYNFYSKYDNFNFDNYYIANEDKSKSFKEYQKRKLQNGMVVFSILIDEQKKMKESYIDLLYLYKEKDIFKNQKIFLPRPNIKNIIYDNENDIFFNDVLFMLNDQ